MLLSAWLVGQIAYWLTRDSAPVEVYIPVDIIAAILIYKYRTNWMDSAILAIYPAMWIAYFTMPELQQWWTLYWLAIAQFVLAGPWPAFTKITGSQQHGPARELPNGVR